MKSFAATVIAFCAISSSAAPPVRRDEWQPSNSNISWPDGAPIPAPTDHPNTGWQPQGDQTCIYITNNYQWMGYGINLCNPAGQCANKLPDGLSGKVLSVGPSQGQVCFLYSGEYCTGLTSDPIVNPGYSNLNDIDFDNAAKSWKCFKMFPADVPFSSSASSSTTTTTSSSSSIQTTLTTSISAVQTTPISLSTTLSSISLTTPGGIPVSRPQVTSTSEVAMTTSTVTLTVISQQTVSAASTILSNSKVSSFSTTSIGVSTRLPTRSVTDGGFTLTTSTFPRPVESGTRSTTTVPSGAVTGSSTSSTLSGFSFNPVMPTFATHTFADGTVTTTML